MKQALLIIFLGITLAALAGGAYLLTRVIDSSEEAHRAEIGRYEIPNLSGKIEQARQETGSDDDFMRARWEIYKAN